VSLLLWLQVLSPSRAQEPLTRAAAPDPAKGERHDGRRPRTRFRDAVLWVPRVLLFPLRALIWAIEPPTRMGVEMEQRNHLYGRMFALLTSDDGLIGIRPSFVWTRSFRPSFGVHVFHDRLLGPGTRSSLDVSGGEDVFAAAVRLRPTRLGRRVHVFFDTSFLRRNDRLFTGIGTQMPLAPGVAARYLENRLDVGARVDLRPRTFLAFTFGGFFGWRRFGVGEGYDGDPSIDESYCVRVDGVCSPVIDEARVPGFNHGTQFARAAAGAHLDLRDNLVRPTVGALVSAETDYSHGLGDDRSSYFRVRGSATIDINLWARSHVLVLRGVTEVVLPTDEGGVVPFSELVTLGGPHDLRGFRVQELRGFSSLVATAEYRWAVLKWIDATLFTDYGGVFDRKYQGFGASRMQPALGFGFRMHSRDRFYLKLQLAHGFNGGGWQIHLTGRNLP
jgi:hypothetical protein